MANTEMLSKTHNPLFKKPNPSGAPFYRIYRVIKRLQYAIQLRACCLVSSAKEALAGFRLHVNFEKPYQGLTS